MQLFWAETPQKWLFIGHRISSWTKMVGRTPGRVSGEVDPKMRLLDGCGTKGWRIIIKRTSGSQNASLPRVVG